MSFEAEVIPLFIGGVLVVSSFELIVGCVLLKNKKSACKKFVLHVITMLIDKSSLTCRSVPQSAVSFFKHS